MAIFKVQGTQRVDFVMEVEAADAETARRLVESEIEEVRMEHFIGNYTPDVDDVEEVEVHAPKCVNPHCERQAHEPESCDDDARCDSCSYCQDREAKIAQLAGETQG